MSKLVDLDQLYARIKSEAGQLDAVFANAGLGTATPLSDISKADFDHMFGVKAKGTLFTVRKALPLMRAGGSIILTGSTTGTMGTPAFSEYSATKAAIRSFMTGSEVFVDGGMAQV